eukprot:TRINITY_DN1667_c0_g1_i3.p1 TRINITY_DN1667_c0_g1~~TRINITY_DN1667_c0_g1_i3.p1  ORF type:complete len:176 (+),score=45.05 TRINITY_DN1667_c0_g1_i3:64-591(+)
MALGMLVAAVWAAVTVGHTAAIGPVPLVGVEERNTALVHQYLNASLQASLDPAQGVQLLRPLLADELLYSVLPSSLHIPSENLSAFLDSWEREIPDPFVDLDITVDEVYAQDDRVAVFLHINGSVATGKVLEQETVLRFHYNAAGKISRFVEFVDSVAIACFYFPGLVNCSKFGL